MADLNDKEAAASTKIVGSDGTGTESNYVQATTAGGLHVNLRDDLGDIYTEDNPLPSIHVGSAADKPWDELVLTRDPQTQDIITATYKKATVTVRVLNFTYDSNENLDTVTKA